MRVWKLGDDIDTDVLAPGTYMKLEIDQLAKHCLESTRADFAANVQPGDVIVAGKNFGIGSSREQAASVLVHLGIAAVIAPSYSGLYFRNAFNVGLLLLTCDQADQIRDGQSIELLEGHPYQIAIDRLGIRSHRLDCEMIPQFLLDQVHAGGLLNQLKKEAVNE
jgi:3-isopropylmalate/(R)-2-methylmalate dehydratase small subunit